MRLAVRGGLLERDEELAAVDDALARARAGEGSVLAVEAPAGLGKTALLAAAQERAAADGMQVLAARGFELERAFTFGILRQLYEPALIADRERGAERLLRGAAAPAGFAIGVGEAPGRERVDPMFAVAHGAYWLTVNLAGDGPVLITIDDAQWADLPSLRCAAYLAARLDDLPVALVVAVRPGEPDAPEEVLASMVHESAKAILVPRPLSVAATTSLIADRLRTQVDPDFAAGAHELTGGNPFFVKALAADLHDQGIAPHGEEANRLPAITSDAVGRAVLVRLTRLGDEAIRLAQAVVVLGDRSPLPWAATLAGLDIGDAVLAAERLTHADILRSAEHLALTHPLVRAAIREEMPRQTRALLHRRAATLLHEADASSELIGSQLLPIPPAGDGWVARRLKEAGEAAEARGDQHGAIAFLRRALDEPPAAEERAELLRVLGRAETRVGDAAGKAHLEEAAELAVDPALKAEIEFRRAYAMLLAGSPEAPRALRRATAGLPPDERGDAVRKQCELIALGRILPNTAPLIPELVAGLEDIVREEGPGWEAALGVTAGQAWLDNRPASAVAEMARRSLEARSRHGRGPAESTAYMNSCYTLSMAGDPVAAEAFLTRLIENARRTNALIGFVVASTFRAGSALRRGDVAQAEADARMALDAAGLSLTPLALPAAAAVLVEVHVERGEPDRAELLLTEHNLSGDLPPVWTFNDVAFARGRLRLMRGQTQAGLDDLMNVGQAARALGARGPGPYPWRAWAAQALAGLGRAGEARELADEGLAVAREYGAPRELGISLRACGLLASGQDGIPLLEESVQVLAESPAELELARSRTDLGAALRRAGRRQAARDVLRDALDAAARCGAPALAERARAELVTAGAKPRRHRTSGLDSLTASERRVADLAVDGLTNRQIAESLFVTTSTVEKHLASAYAKLGIEGRAGLAAAVTPTSS